MAEPAPGPAARLRSQTTGLEPRRDAIVALGCVPVESRTIVWGTPIARWSTTRGPSARDLGALATHQVLPAEQRGGLGLVALLELVELRLAVGTVLLAHGASIERGFLVAAAQASASVRRHCARCARSPICGRSSACVRTSPTDCLPSGARHAAIPTSLGAARSFFWPAGLS